MQRFKIWIIAARNHCYGAPVGSAAPIAAFMATKGGGRTGPAPEAERKAVAERRMAKPGYFVSRCKAPTRARRKIVGRSHCRAGPLAARSPSQKAVARLFAPGANSYLLRRIRFNGLLHRRSCPTRSGSDGDRHKTCDIFGHDFAPYIGAQCLQAEFLQIFVEIA